MDQELELKDVVRKLRQDLQAAAEEGQGQAIKFKLETIELELKVAAKQVGGVEGGIKFYVFNFGAKDQVESEQALTIKLKMTPEGSEGGTARISNSTGGRPAVPGQP